MQQKKVPFYPNTADNTHCFQAALRMLLKYYFPDEEYSWEQLERLTHKPEGKWTWAFSGLAYMKKKGLEVIHQSTMDYILFARDGRDYLQSYFTPQNLAVQDQYTDLDAAQADAKDYIDSGVEIRNTYPTYEDLQKFYDDDYLLICYVNKKHFVVVYCVTDNDVYLHNPGLPPAESQRMLKEAFTTIWNHGQIMAFRQS